MRKNPWTFRGKIEHCWLFTWRTPVDAVRDFVPKPLELVTFSGFAFWNVVVCEIAGLRPWPLPEMPGVKYWHVGYRLYVRTPSPNGSSIEGLYFVQSDCDSPIVAFAGNVLTDFRFHCAEIDVVKWGGLVHGRIEVPGGSATFRLGSNAAPGLSPGSPFASLAEAEAFLKYRPCGLSVCGDDAVNAVHIVRREEEWRSRLMDVEEAHWEFFDGKDAVPELCWEIAPIRYQWNRGEIIRSSL